MITKFEQFNEGIKHLMLGPTDDEIIDNLKQLPPDKMLLKCCQIGLLEGVKVALERGAKISYDNFEPLMESVFYGHSEVEDFLRSQYPPTPKEFFLSLLEDIKKRKYGTFSEKVLWYKNVPSTVYPEKFSTEIFFRQNTKTKEFLIENNQIWNVFLKIYCLNNYEIKDFIKEEIKERLNLEEYKISYF